MNEYMKTAIKLAKKAYKHGDVPVGAVIVKNNRIIGKGYNQREKKHNVLLHAELIAISHACKKQKNWYLNDCELYVTLEPCMMCMGAILQSHIKKITYVTPNNKYGFTLNYKEKIKIEVDQSTIEPTILLQNFFKSKR